MQAAYEEFGCNDGNVFFLGIDKGSTNYSVMQFDSIYGVHYPSVSGQEGGGNAIHFLYDIQATPSIVVITPDKLIATHQIWPPTTSNVVDSVLNAGGILQSCTTGTGSKKYPRELLTLSPNPARDKLIVTLQTENPVEPVILVMNGSGQKIAEVSPGSIHGDRQSIEIDLSGQPAGLYFLQFFGNGKLLETKKLILQH